MLGPLEERALRVIHHHTLRLLDQATVLAKKQHWHLPWERADQCPQEQSRQKQLAAIDMLLASISLVQGDLEPAINTLACLGRGDFENGRQGWRRFLSWNRILRQIGRDGDPATLSNQLYAIWEERRRSVAS